VLTDELYQQARCELERRLLEETGATETTPTMAPRQVVAGPVDFSLAIIIPTVMGCSIGNWESHAMTEPPLLVVCARSSDDAHRLLTHSKPGRATKQKMEQNPNEAWMRYCSRVRNVEWVSQRGCADLQKAVTLDPDDAAVTRRLCRYLGVVHGFASWRGRPKFLIFPTGAEIESHNVKALIAGRSVRSPKDFARAAGLGTSSRNLLRT